MCLPVRCSGQPSVYRYITTPAILVAITQRALRPGGTPTYSNFSQSFSSPGLPVVTVGQRYIDAVR